MICLENDALVCEIDEKQGTLLRLVRKEGMVSLLAAVPLAAGCRLLVPTASCLNNRAWPDPHTLQAEVTGKEEATLRWSRVEGDHAGPLDIGVELRIRLSGAQLLLGITVSNASAYTVEEVWGPILSLSRPDPALSLCTVSMCGGLQKTRLDDGFTQSCGYWGVDHPTQIQTYPGYDTLMPFVLLDNGQCGMYLGVHDEQRYELLYFVAELLPGYLDSKHNRLPAGTDGQPAGFTVSLARMPFIRPGETCSLHDVVLYTYAGDWHDGVAPYTAWRNRWYRQAQQPAWLDDVDTWMTLQMNSPVDDVRYRYTDLPAIAREAKEAGVGAIQLIGWTKDGQDGNEPFQDYEPRLGTYEELQAGIAAAEAMGVHMLLMCKFNWADQTVPGYEKMRRHAALDRNGNPFPFAGHAYQTLSSLMRYKVRNGVVLCHLSPDFRRDALAELDKILALKPSGILYDELIPGYTCFSPEHDHGYGECAMNGSLILARDFYERAREALPEFLLAGEGVEDRVSRYYAVNYIRSSDGYYWANPHIPVWKYMVPSMRFATCLTGYDDREMLNQCLAYGYIANYEPRHFKARLSEAPLTVAYGRRIQALRRRLRDYIWCGIFRDTRGAALRLSDGGRRSYYTVFEHRDGKGKAVVIVNDSTDGDLQVTMEQAGTVYTPEAASPAAFRGEWTVPPRSAAVIVL